MADGAGSGDVASAEADVERSREELAHTVDQLAGRLGQQRRQATSVAGKVGAGVGVVVVVLLVVKAVRSRRTGKRR